MWTVETSGFPGLYAVYDEDGNQVVRHTTHDRARLIAAAPDLLEALEALLEKDGYMRQVGKQVECGYCGGAPNDHSTDCPIKQARAALGRAEGDK